MDDGAVFRLAARLKQLKGRKEELEEARKELNRDIEEAQARLAGLMIDAELRNFTRDGTQFVLVNAVRASARAGAREELFSALREQGHGGMVSETVNANSLSSFVKEQIEENGGDLPGWLEGLVSVFEQPTVQLKKT